MKLKSLTLAFGAVMASTAIASAADCEKLVLGSAISLTGKYATNGVHAKNGYEFAIKKIDENGGVLNTQGDAISGLFACGEIVGGVFQGGYPGGSGLTSGAVFGRISGIGASTVK